MPNDDDQTGDPDGPLPAARSRLHAWLELVRLPNLLTVPGDPLAGFFLAGAGQPGMNLVQVIPCAAASLFLYMAGTVSNDCFDLEEDLKDRPERPLPSRRVHPGTALFLAVVLFALGVGCAVLAGVVPAMVACMLTIAIVAYNAGGKRVTFWGPLNMGLCRGLSLMLGAAAFGATGLTSMVVLVPAAGLTLYVAAVTLVAARETTGKPPGNLAFLPVLALILLLACWLVLTPWESEKSGTISFSLGCLTIILTFFVARKLRTETDSKRVSRGIGHLILMLIPLQGSLAAVTGQLHYAAIYAAVVILLFCAERLGRWFYAS